MYEIVVKFLYGDIYPKAYWNRVSYYFDKYDNLNIFYNDTSHAKGKYFNYIMFSKDEPNMPKYEQKIGRR